MNHIFYQTKTKFTNTGDALINKALIEALRHYGRLHANCSSDIPDFFINELGISKDEKIITPNEIFFVKSVLKCSRATKKGDKIYIFSGLGDSYGGNINQVIRNIMAALLFAVFRFNGVKIIRIGRSVGPLTKPMQLSEKIRSYFLSYNYVRDSKSLQRCQKYGMKNVQYCPDMSWLYDMRGTRSINSTNAIMVNLRNSIFDDVEKDFVDATLTKLDIVLEMFSSVLGNKMSIIVVYQIEEDAAFSRTVYARLKSKYNVQYIDHQLKLDEIEKYYRMVDYHISNRMHSLLAGYKYGSLPIALIDENKHTKISATLKDCGLEDIIVDIHNNDKMKIKYIISHRDLMMNILFECEKNMQKQICNTFHTIFGLR